MPAVPEKHYFEWNITTAGERFVVIYNKLHLQQNIFISFKTKKAELFFIKKMIFLFKIKKNNIQQNFLSWKAVKLSRQRVQINSLILT